MALHISTNCRQLVANDLIGNQWLAECVALVGVFERLRQAGASLAIAADRHDEALLVEVRHDDPEAFVLLPEEILDRYADIVHLDEAGATTFLSTVGYAPPCEAFRVDGYNDDRDATHAWTACSYSGRHVRCSGHAGDPFLVAIHNVMFAVGGFLRGRL